MGNFRGHVSDTAIHLCIDMQKMFAPGAPWATPWLERVLPVVVRLIERAPARCIFTRFIPPQNALVAPGMWHSYFKKWERLTLERIDRPLLDLVEPLQKFVPPARLIDRVAAYSAFSDGLLHQQLRNANVDTLIFSGSETDLCVFATIVTAVDHGYRIIVASDAVCSSSDESHDAMVDLLARRFDLQVEVAATDDIISAWRPAS